MKQFKRFSIEEIGCLKITWHVAESDNNPVTGSWSRDPWGSLQTRDRLQ